MIVLPDDVDLPDRDTVLGQAIPFDRAGWASLLPIPPGGRLRSTSARRWAAGLGWTGAHLVRHRPPGRHRRGSPPLLVAALVWGTGIKAQSVNRRDLRHSSPAGIDAQLGEALDVLRERRRRRRVLGLQQRPAHPAPGTGVLHQGALLRRARQRHSAPPPGHPGQRRLTGPQDHGTPWTPVGQGTDGPRTNTGCTWTGCTNTRGPEASSRIKSRGSSVLPRQAAGTLSVTGCRQGQAVALR